MSDRDPSRAMLATGFVADDAAHGSVFPSAGGRSSSAAVQAVYWRCIAVFFYSARLSNPDLALALFSNVTPPVVDGVDIGALLDRLNVEQHCVALTHRLPPERAFEWGNVFYFLDILDALERRGGREHLVLADCDIIVTANLSRLFDRVVDRGLVGYAPPTREDQDVNGLTLAQMSAIAATIGGSLQPLVHYGGELLGIDLAGRTSLVAALRHGWEQALDPGHPLAGVRTEEHLWSIVFAARGEPAVLANDVIRQIWTSPRFNNVEPGDIALDLWHLPAEKRYGFADLFAELARRDFAPVPVDAFRARAARLCGLPRKTTGKLVRDGVRQLRAKLGPKQ